LITATSEPSLPFFEQESHQERVLAAVAGYFDKKTARKGRRTAVRPQKRLFATDILSDADKSTGAQAGFEVPKPPNGPALHLL